MSYCIICHLVCAPGDQIRRFNGFTAHERCLEKKLPQFRENVGRLVKSLARYDQSFSGFSNTVEELRKYKDATNCAIALYKKLSNPPLKKEKVFTKKLEELKDLTQKHLLWEIPTWTFSQSRER